MIRNFKNFVVNESNDDLNENYIRILFLRSILGDLYEGNHEQFIGKHITM